MKPTFTVNIHALISDNDVIILTELAVCSLALHLDPPLELRVVRRQSNYETNANI